MACGCMWLDCGLHRLFPQKHRKLNTPQAPLPLRLPAALSCRGKEVPVHCCSMAWTWASVNSQQYASFFHSCGRRYLEASRHSTERSCCVSCRWSCLKVRLFPEGSLGSLSERWSCGADAKSSNLGEISARLSPMILDWGVITGLGLSVRYSGFCLNASPRPLDSKLLTLFLHPEFLSSPLCPPTPLPQSKDPQMPPLPGRLPNSSLFSVLLYSTGVSRVTQQL